ncbi:MAG: nucleotide exchange factor GrpE [Bryobacteraceae bacterium]
MPEEKSILETVEELLGPPADAKEAAHAAEAGEPGPPSHEQIDAIVQERDKLLADKSELQDMLLRRQADFENFRRRSDRERGEFREYASLEAVQAVLPILDDFERALQSTPATTDAAIQEYIKGTELIHQRLVETLSKLGLEPIVAVGHRFDPNLHNAIQREDRPDVDEEVVLEEFRRGYNFKGRLLRASLVKVAVKS